MTGTDEVAQNRRVTLRIPLDGSPRSHLFFKYIDRSRWYSSLGFVSSNPVPERLDQGSADKGCGCVN